MFEAYGLALSLFMLLCGTILGIYYTVIFIHEWITHFWHWKLGDTITYIASFVIFGVGLYLKFILV